MSNKILFVLEGEKSEDQVVECMKRYFVNEKSSVLCVYGGEIYQLYSKISADNDFDTFTFIKDRDPSLRHYTRHDFAEIYLFFDYDGQSDKANDEKLSQMLDFFSEETDKGKLYISYPMIEALKHVCPQDDFKNVVVPWNENSYKALVNREGAIAYRHYSKYTKETWQKLIVIHLKKMNFIVHDVYNIPNEMMSQKEILVQQLAKYTYVNGTVGVLSAFPVFLYDYYVNKWLMAICEKQGQ